MRFSEELSLFKYIYWPKFMKQQELNLTSGSKGLLVKWVEQNLNIEQKGFKRRTGIENLIFAVLDLVVRYIFLFEMNIAL